MGISIFLVLLSTLARSFGDPASPMSGDLLLEESDVVCVARIERVAGRSPDSLAFAYSDLVILAGEMRLPRRGTLIVESPDRGTFGPDTDFRFPARSATLLYLTHSDGRFRFTSRYWMQVTPTVLCDVHLATFRTLAQFLVFASERSDPKKDPFIRLMGGLEAPEIVAYLRRNGTKTIEEMRGVTRFAPEAMPPDAEGKECVFVTKGRVQFGDIQVLAAKGYLPGSTREPPPDVVGFDQDKRLILQGIFAGYEGTGSESKTVIVKYFLDEGRVLWGSTLVRALDLDFVLVRDY